MPQLQNPKRERFAQHMANGGMTQAEAYSAAGYTPSTSNASILANNPDVKARIAEIKEEKQKEEVAFKLKLKQAGIDPDDAQGQLVVKEWSADRVREMLAHNAVLAQITGDFKAAKESLELVGKSLGMFDKDGNSNGGGKPAGPQVSLTLINEATGGDQAGAGPRLVEGSNPLRPRLPSSGGPVGEREP